MANTIANSVMLRGYPPVNLGQLGARLGISVDAGIAERSIAALALPRAALADDLTFLYGPAPSPQCFEQLLAAAILTDTAQTDRRALRVVDVLQSCARVCAWLPVRRSRAAAVDIEQHDASAQIAASATLGRHIRIGAHSTIGAGAVLGEGVSIGAFSSIGPNCVIGDYAEIGNRVVIGSGCSIGEDGFAFIRDGHKWLRMPCFGSVTVADDVVIRPRTVIHAGVFGDTRLGAGCVLDSNVLIGHDSSIGQDCAIAGQTAIAGAAVIGDGCRIAGKVGVGEGVRIANGVTVTAMSMVSRNLDQPGSSYSSGWPAEPSRRWWRRVATRREDGKDAGESDPE